MRVRKAGDLAVATQAARDHKADVALRENVGGAVADAGLRPRIRDGCEAVGVLVEVGSLLRVSDPEFEVVPALEGHEVLTHVEMLFDGRRRRGPAPALEQNPEEDRDAARDGKVAEGGAREPQEAEQARAPAIDGRDAAEQPHRALAVP